MEADWTERQAYRKAKDWEERDDRKETRGLCRRETDDRRNHKSGGVKSCYLCREWKGVGLVQCPLVDCNYRQGRWAWLQRSPCLLDSNSCKLSANSSDPSLSFLHHPDWVFWREDVYVWQGRQTMHMSTKDGGGKFFLARKLQWDVWKSMFKVWV